MTFGLEDKDWNILRSLVIDPLQNLGATVWVFGSRATGRFRKFSDIDLLYDSKQVIPAHMLFKLKSEIEESDLPIKVDLVSLSDLAEGYREQALRDRIEIQ